MKNKIALITGVTGQDGSYLAEYLISKNYIVHGIKRKSSSFNTSRVDHLFQEVHEKKKRFFLHYCDMTDSLGLVNIIKNINPCEIYNLAAQSHVRVSFDIAEYTTNVNALGLLRILEAVKSLSLINKIRIYHASTSELYGKIKKPIQDEKTDFYPRSPYAVSKLFAHWIGINYREAYKMHVCNGILFNHESPRRGDTFVTKKIVSSVVKLIRGEQNTIHLGNLNAKRDWGHAKDYVKAMHSIVQYKKPDDWVISTGKTTSVRSFLIKTFNYFGISLYFKGTGLNEKGYIKLCKNRKFNLKKHSCVIKIDQRYFRPTEVDLLKGDSSKARKILNWKPAYSLEKLIKEMIEHELNN
jgi:GDPmannose 4,6-dehydratase